MQDTKMISGKNIGIVVPAINNDVLFEPSFFGFDYDDDKWFTVWILTSFLAL